MNKNRQVDTSKLILFSFGRVFDPRRREESFGPKKKKKEAKWLHSSKA